MVSIARPILLLAIALLLFAAIRVAYMVATLGKPLATLDHAGVTLANGKAIPWADIRELSLQSIGVIVTVRTDLVLHFEKGRPRPRRHHQRVLPNASTNAPRKRYLPGIATLALERAWI